MAEHEHGSMDTTEQERAYHGFMKAAVYVAAATILILIFLAIVGT